MSIELDSPPREYENYPLPSSPPPRSRVEKRFTVGVIALVVLGVVALAALLLRGGGTSDAEETLTIPQPEVVELLLRTGPTSAAIELESLYTPTWYFDWSGQSTPAASGEPALAFFLFETIHAGELADELPDMYLTIDGQRLAPMDARPVTTASHHRVTQVFFPADSDGGLVTDEAAQMQLSATTADGVETSFTWAFPLDHGLGILNTDTAETGLIGPSLTVGAILAIFGGMLTALSPCLLLLGTYYSAVLSGAAASGATGESATRKLMTTGLFFVAGFTLIYTLGGVFAGFVGESITRLDGVGRWARPASVVAGIAVVLMGIRVASQAKVPVVCKIPGFNRPEQSGWVGSAVMGSTFAVGCLSCFSATVLSALLLYAGATGSPVTGGLIMFVFSAGVGVMFMAAAWLLSQAAPLMKWLEKARPYIGGVSAAIMIFFGILMITYQFHIVTGKMFELWS